MYFVPFDISFSFLLPFCFGEQSAIFIVQTWLWEEESFAKPPGSRIFLFYKILCHWMSGVFQCSYNKIRHIAPLWANRSPMCGCRGYRQHSHADVWEFASFVFSSTYHYQSPRTVRLLELWVIPQSSYLLTPADFFELCKERSEEKGGGDEYVSYVKHLRLWSHNSSEKCINKHSISHLASFVAPSIPPPATMLHCLCSQPCAGWFNRNCF